jgi:hypothetical protein
MLNLSAEAVKFGVRGEDGQLALGDEPGGQELAHQVMRIVPNFDMRLVSWSGRRRGVNGVGRQGKVKEPFNVPCHLGQDACINLLPDLVSGLEEGVLLLEGAGVDVPRNLAKRMLQEQ